MKTKKAILEWWNKLGETPFRNDLIELEKKIDSSILFDKFWDNSYLRITLKKSSWKFPLKLYFEKNDDDIDCYKIVGY